MIDRSRVGHLPGSIAMTVINIILYDTEQYDARTRCLSNIRYETGE